VFGSVAVTYLPDDMQSAQLIRQRDGYWRPPPSTRGSRVAGVLYGESKLKPWSVASHLPEMWLNPWAPTPVTAELPFATHTAKESGDIVSAVAQISPQQLFQLPATAF
jgi:hypothetical protein